MEQFSNKEIAKMFAEYSDIMKILDKNKYRIRAYDNAFRILSDSSIDLQKLIKEDRLKEIKGIGEGIGSTIKEIFNKGYFKDLQELKKELPPNFLELLEVPGLGPKTAGKFLKKLNIKNIKDLKKALKEQQVREIKGMGTKTEKNLLKSLTDYEEYVSYINLNIALDSSEQIIEELKSSSKQFLDIKTAGSIRRKKLKIGDLDILISVEDKTEHNLLKEIKNTKIIESILLEGDTKISARTIDGLQIDFRVVNQKEFPAALQYFTGSKYHNVKIRQIAKSKGFKLNEYGVFKADKRVEIVSEKEIYELLGLKYIEPELREDSGEIEAAKKDKLPDLIKYDQINGDFHVHSNYSDGNMSIKEMINTAQKRGYKFLAITDHSKSLKIANGLSEDDLKKQWKEIDSLREKYPEFLILKGIEVDINKDGSLDYEDDILKKFDLVIGSVHSNFNQKKEEMTKRLVKAINNPYIDIIGHPTGRMLGQRPAYQIDFEKILKAISQNNVILEINCSPSRFDLDDQMAREVIKNNQKLIINTDSHHSDQYDYMKYGVSIAKRAWAESKDIVNTYTVKQIKELFEVK
ncbi:MAG: DNA polymerase/3'-5' exonuclease PolX [Halanaerobiales bacterium]|nr:DNA polymerase/3'-5' exonuclease PolX [Halanaerobiales bacterium]